MRKNAKIITLSLFTLAVLSACKNNDKSLDPIALSKNSASTENTEPEIKNFPQNYLEIEGNDLMKFNLKELKAKAGEPITLVLKHVGKADKLSMGHNVVILKPGTDVDGFAAKAIKDQAHDYIPQSELSSIIAHTKLLGGGESDTITFTINKKGSYDFICSFPAHHSMMNGKLIIE